MSVLSAFQSPHSSFTSRPPCLHHPSIHPSLILKAQTMMTVLSDTFSPSSVFLPQSIRPFICPQSPAVLASVSEPSPPRTWRPRSPAPRKGSGLQTQEVRERERDNNHSSLHLHDGTAFGPCTHINTHSVLILQRPLKISKPGRFTHTHTLPCSSISESIFAR